MLVATSRNYLADIRSVDIKSQYRITEASVLPDGTVRLVWDTCASTNLDPSDPRYAVMSPEKDKRRFTAYLDKTSTGELSIKKIDVKELTEQTGSK